MLQESRQAICRSRALLAMPVHVASELPLSAAGPRMLDQIPEVKTAIHAPVLLVAIKESSIGG